MYKKILRYISNPTNNSKIIILFINFMLLILEYFLKLFFLVFSILKKNNKKLYCIYDLSVNPLTFDFIWFLFSSESERINNKKNSIELILITGKKYSSVFETNSYHQIFNQNYKKKKFKNIIVSSARLLPSIKKISIFNSNIFARLYAASLGSKFYPSNFSCLIPYSVIPSKDAIKYSKKNNNFNILRSSKVANNFILSWLKNISPKKKFISITLRQSDYTKERNSNLNSWSNFSKYLEEQNFIIILLPDFNQLTNVSLLKKYFPKAHVCKKAVLNIDYRLSLYKSCDFNLGVSNGPMSLCYFSNSKFIQFKSLNEKIETSNKKMMIKLGFNIKKNPPFFNSKQRFVWNSNESSEYMIKIFKNIYEL